ncbi:NAD-glutamate dehydrogenase [Simkania negevensis]|uniref:NAD-glutamate dehydrogenase n=1 Tax=Simkania negevensis TaxID=83561 RepID=A0ABS3AQR0_9BACT|nr:NAD-glutamate dehydrogenase [Simkania negevensis]
MAADEVGSKKSKEGCAKFKSVIERELCDFEIYYDWLEKAMPAAFFEEVNEEELLLIVHALMGFEPLEFFAAIKQRRKAAVLCLDTPDADVRILNKFRAAGIKNYLSYVSSIPLPNQAVDSCLRIGMIYFTEAVETVDKPFSKEAEIELRTLVMQRNPQLTEEEFQQRVDSMNRRFLRSLPMDRLVLAWEMFFRAQTRDHCQYEVRYNEDWKKTGMPSVQIVFAWRNTPKYNFLQRLTQVVYRHGLVMQRLNATYTDPYSPKSVLIMAIGLHGTNNKAAWDAADIADFLKELVLLKYFPGSDSIEKIFVDTGMITGNQANFLRCTVDFVHQLLVHDDPFLYSLENVEEACCRHPEITVALCRAFEAKFHPDRQDIEQYQSLQEEFLGLVCRIDTGHEINDVRRRNVLEQAMHFVQYMLKTNFYRNNKTSLSFRLDPAYLDAVPFDRPSKFPELPYAIFFIKGMHFISFHVRFKDLARGGVRTVLPERMEQMVAERIDVFQECYNLAYTQHKKNKDIPEGGAKALIFLEPYERLDTDTLILKKELEVGGASSEEVDEKIDRFRREQQVEFIHQSQRAFVSGLLTLVNCEEDGTLKAKHVVDYWKKPEYVYLGPDEKMSDTVIQWIAHFSKQYGYRPGGAFISGKPDIGINHKEYGVTSLGVDVYMHEGLKYLSIDPKKDPFTVKMTGGPNGDVAGNQIRNLYKHCPNTAKIVALRDGSGTIRDLEGLDLVELLKMSKERRSICEYPVSKLSEGSFLLNTRKKREADAYSQQTLCWRKHKGRVVEDWLSGNEMNRLLRNNVHEVPVDVFIPGGGRPRTVNDSNVHEFLTEAQAPTAKLIVEGANLYFSTWARVEIEKKGAVIVKDSSANKCGVICSSYEIICGLTLSDAEFMEHKSLLVEQILDILRKRAMDEAQLMFSTYKEEGGSMIAISDEISHKINMFTDQLLEYLGPIKLSNKKKDPLIRCFLNYCPALLADKYSDRMLKELPDIHKKAVIASYLAATLVYKRGLQWWPTIVDVLPIILSV